MNDEEMQREAAEIVRRVGTMSLPIERCASEIVQLCTRVDTEARQAQREADAEKCEALKGDGDKPSDRLIGYEECAAAIRNGEQPK